MISRATCSAFCVAAVVVLSQPAQAKDLVLSPINVRSPVYYTQLLQRGLNAQRTNNYYEAASAFMEVLSSNLTTQKFYAEAQYGLAKSFYFLKYYYAGLSYFDKIVEAGPAHHRYVATMRWLLLLTREIPGAEVTLERLARYPKKYYPPKTADEIGFLVGRYHYYQGEMDKALNSFKDVRTVPEFMLGARFMEGVIFARQYKGRDALNAFKNILRYIRDKRPNGKFVRKYQELAHLSMARLFYSTRQFKTSIRYYDMIPIQSIHWLNSLFESSYAYFRLGGRKNFEKAMGNLHTLRSPYFESEYFPEALIIQSVILYTNCHFSATLGTVDSLIREYFTLVRSLQGAIKKYDDPNDFYAYLANLSRQRGAGFSIQLKRILNAALADRHLSRKFRFVIYLNKELQRMGLEKNKFKDPQLVNSLLSQLNIYKELVLGETGRLARSRVKRVVKELRGLISLALKIKYETLIKQKTLLTSKIQHQRYQEKRSRRGAVRVSKEHMYWPFYGEYWKDELGYYIYQVESRCSR